MRVGLTEVLIGLTSPQWKAQDRACSRPLVLWRLDDIAGDMYIRSRP